jgi:motility quorum-sensing regulator/GCU-specific mRNA interferase toxin
MPRYNLSDIQKLVLEGRYHVTLQAGQDAFDLGFDSEGVRECVLALNETHFYKSMPAEKVPGLWQDVYRLRYEGTRVYLKLQIDFDGKAVVISFKEDTG